MKRDLTNESADTKADSKSDVSTNNEENAVRNSIAEAVNKIDIRVMKAIELVTTMFEEGNPKNKFILVESSNGTVTECQAE